MRYLYVDGSILWNPGGALGYSVCDGEGNFLAGRGEAICAFGNTNNIAEVLAVLAAIEIATDSIPTTIVSDSQYAVFQLTTRRARWEAKAARGKQPENYALLCHVAAQLDKNPNISLRWEPGHCGHRGNESADRHARKLAREARTASDHQVSS